MQKSHTATTEEYHLIDIVTGESHGGFVSLYGAREAANAEILRAWQIFRGNNRIEHHDPDNLASGRTPLSWGTDGALST